MKKTVLILGAISLVFATTEAKNKKPVKTDLQVPEKILVNDVDSMSYALGLNVGADFAKNIKGIPGGKSNIDLLVKGFATAMKGDSSLMKPQVAMEFFKSYITKAQAKDTEVKKAAGEKFLAENKTKDSVITTASGLQYKVLVAKDGAKPQATDSVKVHYQGFLIDGTKFDSSVDRGEPITFPLNQVIPGWTEGVQLMSIGSKYKFFVPYKLAYGEKGAGNGAIPGYATLIFEVELFDIKPVKQIIPVPENKPAVAPKVIKKGTAKRSK
jgi:FKBP-type peptidyl-prolyl cis-trans isomerase